MKRLLYPLVVLMLGAFLGGLSAQYMMENASVASVVSGTGWKEIRVEGDTLDSTYQTAHFLSRGQIPPPRDSRFFVRSLDDDGNSLRADCVVNMEGKLPTARWWFVSASTTDGRTSLDAAQSVREMNGDVNISISQTPTPGNWLVPPQGGAYELRLVILGASAAEPNDTLVLPRVKRLWC
jgi:hypothetical protein